jgi:hypothetical protein
MGVEKIIEEIESMNPYKDSGNRDSYNDYNQGWSDACDVLGERIKEHLGGKDAYRPITEELLADSGFKKHFAYYKVYGGGFKKISVEPNDGDMWYVFIQNINYPSHIDEIVCARNDLRYFGELRQLYLGLTGEELELKRDAV